MGCDVLLQKSNVQVIVNPPSNSTPAQDLPCDEEALEYKESLRAAILEEILDEVRPDLILM